MPNFNHINVGPFKEDVLRKYLGGGSISEEVDQIIQKAVSKFVPTNRADETFCGGCGAYKLHPLAKAYLLGDRSNPPFTYGSPPADTSKKTEYDAWVKKIDRYLNTLVRALLMYIYRIIHHVRDIRVFAQKIVYTAKLLQGRSKEVPKKRPRRTKFSMDELDRVTFDNFNTNNLDKIDEIGCCGFLWGIPAALRPRGTLYRNTTSRVLAKMNRW